MYRALIILVWVTRIIAQTDISIVETGKKSPINPHIYGVMTQGAYFAQGLDSRENGVYFHQDSTALAILRRLPLDNMRMLGGTNTWGNSIHNKGHGYKTHCGDLLMDEVVVDCYKDEDEPINFHYLHVDMAKAMQVMNVVYVVNYLQPAAEIDSLFTYWKAEGINIIAAELGNEYHLGKFRPVFSNPDIYADWAAAMSDTIKQIDPDIKTGVMLPKPYTVAGSNYYQTWMNALSSRYKAGTLNIDFVVCHIYQQIQDCYNSVSCEQGNACVARRLPWTDDHRRLYMDTRYQMMKTWYYEWIPDYFPGCQLYFTEWALKKRVLGHGNTLMGAWHVVRELMEFHRANHEYDGIIGAAHYTKLLHPDSAPANSLLQPYTIAAIGAQEPNLQNSKTFIGSTEAEAFALFKPVHNGYYLETLQKKPSGMDAYIRFEILQGSDGNKYLFYANCSDSSFRVNLVGENKTMYGNWNNAGGITTCNRNSWALPTLAAFDDDNLLRPRSVGRIKIKHETEIEQSPDVNLPQSCFLGQNYPNPFNAATKIEFAVQKSGHVELDIYNLKGELILALIDAKLSAGSHDVKLEGKDLTTGVYFYSLQTESSRQTKKLLLIK